MAGVKGEAPCFTGSGLASIFLQPRTSWVETVLPAVDWSLLHQLAIKTTSQICLQANQTWALVIKTSSQTSPLANQIWASTQLRFPSQVISGLPVMLTVRTNYNSGFHQQESERRIYLSTSPVAKEITCSLLFYIYTNKLGMTIQNDPKASKFQKVLLPTCRKSATSPVQELYLSSTLTYTIPVFKEVTDF